MIEKLLYKIKSKNLSKSDEDAILLCQKCKWLKRIDFKRLKIYCNLPHCCEGDENFEVRV